jgi:cell division protein FtsL
MRNKRRHYKPVNVFWAFVTAFSIIVIPVSGLLVETWLNLSILAFDYENDELSKELERAQAHIETLRARIAELERMERIDAEALELGLVKREHNQLVIVNGSPGEAASQLGHGFDVADGRSPGVEQKQPVGLEKRD